MKKLYRAPILGEKQVGDVSYCVESLFVLINILKLGEIWKSSGQEYNPRLNKQMNYVSLSRNLTAPPKRNNSRWKYGVILDGTKLSNRYHIEPYSFANVSFNYKQGFIIKTLRAYDNDTYNVSFVNHPTHEISRESYELLKSRIEDMTEDQKNACKLEYSGEGKIYRNGRKLKESYNFNRKQGGLKVDNKTFTSSEVQDIFHHTMLNETEERIWIDEPINISNCIKGIVLPSKDLDQLENHTSKLYEDLDDVTIEATGTEDYEVATY